MKYFFLLITPLVICNNITKKIIKDTSPVNKMVSQQDTGWTSLFDGKTLNGWHTYGNSFAAAAWKIDSNAIHLDASKKDKDDDIINGGDLLTDNEYNNFDLKLQWKISKGGNSGIKFYVQEDTNKYNEAIGLEMQVLDNDGHSDGRKPKHRAGSLYDLVAPNAEVTKPVGEWNDVEIICNNGKLEFYLNSTKIVTAILWNDEWKKMIAHSKYKHMKNWGTFKTGHIALQDHGFDVWYRNIMIKKL